jgi:hypothetical protein
MNNLEDIYIWRIFAASELKILYLPVTSLQSRKLKHTDYRLMSVTCFIV